MSNNAKLAPKTFDAGIDLGTTLSGIGRLEGDVVKLARYSHESTSLLPTAVHISKGDGEAKIGSEALGNIRANPHGFAWRWKPLTGLAYEDDKAREIIGSKKYSEMEVEKAQDARELVFKLNGEPYSPMDLSSIFLEKLKNGIDKTNWGAIDNVVISVPAYFDGGQKKCTRAAAEKAGFANVALIEEPVAAAIYRFWRECREEGPIPKVLVYDFGGGTFDASLVVMGNGKNDKGETIPQFTVLKNKGDMILGGDDVDQELYNLCFEQIKNKYGGEIVQEINNSQDGMLKQFRFVTRQACEKCKIQLSDSPEVPIYFKQALRLKGQTMEIEVNLRLKREAFEALISTYVGRTHKKINELFKEEEMSDDNVDFVLAVGGSTLIPLVRKTLTDRFGEKVIFPEDPQECVVKGAAVFAAHPEWLEAKHATYNTGVEVASGILEPVINAGTPMFDGAGAVDRRPFRTVIAGQEEIATWIWQWETNADPTPNSSNRKVAYLYFPLPPSLPEGTPINIELGTNQEEIVTYGTIWIGQEERKLNCIAPLTGSSEETLLSEELSDWERDFRESCEQWAQDGCPETENLIKETRDKVEILKKGLGTDQGNAYTNIREFLREYEHIPHRIKNCPFALGTWAELRGKTMLQGHPELQQDVTELQGLMGDIRREMERNNLSPRQITVNGEVWKLNLHVTGPSDYPDLLEHITNMIGISYKIMIMIHGGITSWNAILGNVDSLVETSCRQMGTKKPPEFDKEIQRTAIACQNNTPDAINILYDFGKKWCEWICEAWIENEVIRLNATIKENMRTDYMANIKGKFPSSPNDMLDFVTTIVKDFCNNAHSEYLLIAKKLR